ncbi:MAG: hypothetical protein C4338_03135 [Rhodanobacteraceae bacterium]
MPRRLILICAIAIFALPLAADAAHRRPGLWQNTSTLRFTKGGPQIPPDVLARMKQQGMDPAKLFTGPHSYKHCLTPEEAAKDEHPEIGNKDCKAVNATWSGSTFRGQMICHSAQHESHGTFEATLHGDDSYDGTFHAEGHDPQLGGDYAMEGTFSGKWLGANCRAGE